MNINRNIIALLLLVAFWTPVIAQVKLPNNIPVIRKKFHDDIDNTQKRILSLDGVDDDQYNPTKDAELNNRITYAVVNRVDELQARIELDSSMDNNKKIKYLRGLNDALNSYIYSASYHQIKPASLPDLINVFIQAAQLEENSQSISPAIENASLEVGRIIVKCFCFQQNIGLKHSKDILVMKDCQLHPDKILPILMENPNLPKADSLIILISRKNQEELYNYAAAPNALGARIQKVNDPLVQLISKLSRMKTGRQYFPFLDDLYRGKTTLSAIDSAMRDEMKYFKLLVQTQVNYASRMMQRDTPLVMQTLTAKLQLSVSNIFINEINGLHNSPSSVRFKILEQLSPVELYYIGVLGEEEIYTSSYTEGVYPMTMQKLKPSRGDTLLMRVYFDHFKKWIKMAANYNTLDKFLKTMEKGNAEILMKAFVRNLDKTSNLEDAVDVANSYASISDKELQKLILNEVQYNLAEAKKTNNKRGTDIYSILNTLFLSIDPANKIDVSATLGIPPVFYMPNSSLKDTAGRIIVEQYFYGDKDGQGIFNSFLNHFSNSNWKISTTADWAAVTSTKGTSVTIYANKPLDENEGLDEQAQKNLNDFLYEKGLEPTIVIHRGHSYFLSTTLKQLAPSAKVIILGSCGGYQSLNNVLETCPYAHIISSKQTGSGTINQPMIDVFMEELRQGKDLNWPALWTTLSKRFAGNSLFADYVPPHKNLGAVFIMAYQKKQAEEEDKLSQQ